MNNKKMDSLPLTMLMKERCVTSSMIMQSIIYLSGRGCPM